MAIPKGKIRPVKSLELGSLLPAVPSWDQGPLLAAALSGLKLTHEDSEGFCDGRDLQGKIQIMGANITLEYLLKKKNLKITCFCQFYKNVSLCGHTSGALSRALQEPQQAKHPVVLSFINFLKN